MTVKSSNPEEVKELERLVEDEMTIGSWAVENFGRPNILAVLRRMCDENLEAIEACVVSNEATRTMFKAMRAGLNHLDGYKLPDDELFRRTPQIAEEVADCQIVACHAGRVMNVSVKSFVDEKMIVNRRRRWRQNTDGTGQHINVDEDIILASVDEEE